MACLPLQLGLVCNVECTHETLLSPATQPYALNVVGDGLLNLANGPARAQQGRSGVWHFPVVRSALHEECEGAVDARTSGCLAVD